MTARRKVTLLLDRFIKDKNGHVAIWQMPNLPIIGWLASMLVTHFAGSAHLKTAFGYLGMAFLFTWAYLEISDGSSYFRRLLGLMIFLGIIVAYMK